MKKLLTILFFIPVVCFSQNKMWGAGGFNTNGYLYYMVNTSDTLLSLRLDSFVIKKPVRAGTINGNTLTTGSYTITGSASKTFTFTNSLTFSGTDGTVMTFPSTSATIARTDAGNSFTGSQLATGYVGAAYFRNTNNNIHLYGASTGTGALTVYDGGESGASIIQLGGTGTSNPAFVRNSANVDVMLANNSAYTGIQSLYDRFGSGSPESVITAPVGAVYHRTDGGAGTSYYVKESGSGNTGWVAK